MRTKYIFSILFLLITFQLVSQEINYNFSNIDDILIKNANAVVLLNHSKIEISSIKNFKQTHKRIVTVLNSSGNRHINAYVNYDSGINIKKLGAIVYNQYGKEIKKFKKSDFSDVSAVSDFSLYEDDRIKYLDYTPTDYPYTIEFYYEKTTDNTAYIPSWTPLDGYYVSTQKSIVEVIYDTSVGINVKENNLSGYDTENLSSDGNLKYIAINIPAIRPEEYSPSFKDFAPKVSITPQNFYYEGYVGATDNWSNLGKWMYDELLSDRVELPESTQAEIKKLVEGITDPIEKTKIVYQFVQENTRYISVQEGIGGIQPISASKVDEVKYGDCKGLTNYTKALLDVVGVNSNYSRVFASREYTTDIDKAFVSFLGQTNHVILNIPHKDEDVWLECTSQTSPFNYTANFTDDRDVFVITPEGGKIVHTKAYETDENRLDTKAIINLDVFGGVKADVIIKSYGTQYSYHDYILTETQKNQELYYKDYWDYINNLTIDKLDFKNDKDRIIFTENVKVKATKYASKTGKRFLVQPNMFNRIEDAPKRYIKRKLPFKIERGFVDFDEYEIAIPKTFEVEAMMEPISISNKFGEYDASIEQQGDILIYKRKFKLNKGSYLKEEYKAFREFWLNIIKYDKSRIVIKPKTINNE